MMRIALSFLVLLTLVSTTEAACWKCRTTKGIIFTDNPLQDTECERLASCSNTVSEPTQYPRPSYKQSNEQRMPSPPTQECYESSIIYPKPFLGNNKEIFKLADQSVWEVKNEYNYLYEYSPNVIICPSRGKLIVGKKSLNVQFVSFPQKGNPTQAGNWEIFEETNLQGSISGTVQQGRIFKTTSGNVYEVTGLTLMLVLELQPEVMVLRNGNTYKLVVEGFDEPLICRKLN